MLKSKYDELVESHDRFRKENDACRHYIEALNHLLDELKIRYSKLEAVNCKLEDQIRKQIKADIVLEMLGDVGLDESILKWEKLKETR